jgi:hypothetical protein
MAASAGHIAPSESEAAMDRYANFPASQSVDDRRGDPSMDPLDVVTLQFKAGADSSRSSVPEPRGNYSGIQAQAGLPALDAIERQSLADFVAQPWRPASGPSRSDMRKTPNDPPVSFTRASGFDESLQIAENYFKRGMISPAEYQRLIERIKLARMAEQGDDEFIGEPAR